MAEKLIETTDPKSYKDGTEFFYKKVRSHMSRIKRDVLEADKRKKRLSKIGFTVMGETDESK